ncbi:hypothetical protein BB559_006437 [Furculomyces boomerangus]|uniref:Uncharacterized protein n=2 Tax=Harpellales TaxID=61421 RepID=A0A2T9Y2X0_9FUNG|nr:hypothetical protein BB559_006437 [Furculomyces boomerangus]PWA00749.1 hypothetical protein BB558_003186 [Smittium angustum]
MDPPSSLLDKLKSFLPLMEQENKTLEESIKIDPKKHLLETDGMGKEYIEMDLGLGVFDVTDGLKDNVSGIDTIILPEPKKKNKSKKKSKKSKKEKKENESDTSDESRESETVQNFTLECISSHTSEASEDENGKEKFIKDLLSEKSKQKERKHKIEVIEH